MDDERVVGAELERLAGTDPLDPIDPQAMLTRGRRSRRTRRLVAGGGGVAAVAAIAVGASLLPGSATSSPEPNVATSSKKAVVSSDFSPVPGVPRGEAAIGAELSLKEANRRCKLRNPTVPGSIQPAPNWHVGITVMYQPAKGQRMANCTIPGGDKPSAALVEATRRDPVPTTAAAQLRNCSVYFWIDMTKWRVRTADVEPGRAAELVAQSPSGKSTVTCGLLVTKYDGAQLDSSSRVFRSAVSGRNTFEEDFQSIPGGQEGCVRDKCKGWLYTATGRIPSHVARIRIEPAGGAKHDITLVDGWFALAWLSSDPQGRPDAKVTAYDKAGKVLHVLNG
ncbi:hypothetical protein ACFVWG_33330 [Kribbella sp. NPDC058245]|uniref:hypothetical protein n=1 Tax=Kribbella sp. NPDC058245 TaxID=3346399 RepID=UPI0036EC8E47